MVKFKNRYIAVEIQPRSKSKRYLHIKSPQLLSSLIHKIQYLHGDFGVAAVRSGLTVKYYNEVTRIALIRVQHGPHQFVTSSLPFVTKLDENYVSICILYTGATLKQCYKFIRNYQMTQLTKLWSTLKTEEEKKKMEESVRDFTNIISFESISKGKKY